MTTTATTAQRHLTDEQIASYRRDGYLALPRFLDRDRVEALRGVTDAFVERSRGVAKTDAVFDLDPRHTAAAPVLRRIKNPADHDPLYFWLGLESPILDVVSELIGPSLRFHYSKLNLKGSLLGAPVEVHQDAAFYPHSNDDVLAVGLLLDDATAENGAMAVLPGSHHGPIYTHFDAKGRFVGCMLTRMSRASIVVPQCCWTCRPAASTSTTTGSSTGRRPTPRLASAACSSTPTPPPTP